MRFRKTSIRTLLLVFMSFSMYTSISSQRTCGTDHYHSLRLQKDKAYAERYYASQQRAKITSGQKSSLVCASTIVVPVAVHFNDPITCDDPVCLLGAVEAQIDAMNEDFLAANADYQRYLDLNAACPASYPLSTAPVQNEGSCVQFCLARMNHPAQSGLVDGDPAITVGLWDWPSASDWQGYLNIFVSNAQGGLGVSPLGGDADGDGFWVTNTAFGGPGFSCTSGGNLNTDGTYNLGRTSTHEAGHYFGLNHVFGSCNNDPDMFPPAAGSPTINDTPLQGNPTYGDPTVNDCGDVIESCPNEPSSFFSFMDYTDDVGMVIFTVDQSAVMNWFANDINFNDDATYCAGSYGNVVCIAAPNCTDNIQNQDEQDVDCGGVNCTDCASYCGLNFYDPGGPTGDYPNNTFNTWTFCPDAANEILSVNFTSWNVENHNNCNWDEMIIYDGNSTGAPVIDSYCTNSPGLVSSSSPGGCLTFTFESDGNVVEEGWIAEITCDLALPVELIDFKAQSFNHSISLFWSTSMELDNEGFEIWRSHNGTDFRKISFVPGHGNTSELKSYQFVDNEVFANQLYYYKLKQLDRSGTYSESNIVSARIEEGRPGELVQVFPNPISQNELNIHMPNIPDASVYYSIVDLSGKILREDSYTGQDHTILLKDVSEGMYLLKVKVGEEKPKIFRLIKI